MGLIIKTTGLEQYAPGGEARIKILTIGGPGVGKRLDVETKVATPTGWRRFGDLEIGDDVIGSQGAATRVLGIYDEGVGPAFRLTLNDGASVICDPEHLWNVQTRKLREQGDQAITLTTRQLLERGIRTERSDRKDRYEFFLPIVAPVQYDKVDDLPIGPYLLGSLLANGSFTGNSSVYLTTNDEDVIDRCIDENAELILIERTHENSTARRWQLVDGHAMLRRLDLDQLLSGDKHVPERYMVAHEPVRRALLAGLMDGDGSVSTGTRARFHTTSVRLARDVQELVWSLGGVARINAFDRTRTDRGIEFSVSVWMSESPFSLSRKADRYSPPPWFRAIESIEPVDDTRMRCIKVDAPDELYVVEHYVVTHNTRWSSYFPAPLFADCEAGLASIADRKMPYVTISNSQDMLDLLAFLKQECRQPASQRKYQTIVIDTLDAFQRKVKNEWLEVNKKEFFTGWDAWGFMNSKMQTLMTRLLNLDMNVIVNVHYKDKTTQDDAGKETTQLMLQLQGELSDTAFNDFDLVGWMGTYWEAVEGERIQKRGLTFRPTPDKPFLKDRLDVTPPWLPVTFSDSDYTSLFERVQAKVAEMEATETVGEVPTATPEMSPFVLPPGATGTGALPPTPEKDVPLGQLDKPMLIKKVRDLGITTTVDGSPIKGNTLKSELIAAIEAHQQKVTEEPKAEEPKAEEPKVSEPSQPEVQREEAPRSTGTAADKDVKDVPEGKVNTKTGELIEPTEANASVAEPTHADAVATVERQLGGKVVQDEAKPVPQQQQRPTAITEGEKCTDCGKSLEGENEDFVKLARIKYKTPLCKEDYMLRKSR